jgi:hypothetical protein
MLCVARLGSFIFVRLGLLFLGFDPGLQREGLDPHPLQVSCHNLTYQLCLGIFHLTSQNVPLVQRGESRTSRCRRPRG